VKDKPESLVILGTTYKITYCDNPSEVDLYKRESLWGQVDYWTRTIRIYDNNRNIEDIWHSIIHEMLHVFGQGLKLDSLDKGDVKDDKKHEELDMIALALADTLFRNDLIKIGG
jgi:predicted Zn-dependent protease with MMP-like domain